MARYAQTMYVYNKETKNIIQRSAGFRVHMKINADVNIVLGLASEDITDVEWVYHPALHDFVQLLDTFEVS